MTWTDIPNGDVDPGSPLSTALMTALRDNVTALAEQAVGAPVLNVAPGIVALAAGDVGTYVFAWRNGTSGVEFGDVVAGSELRPAALAADFNVQSNRTELASLTTMSTSGGTGQATLSGTWRSMGDNDYSFNDNYPHTLFLRIT